MLFSLLVVALFITFFWLGQTGRLERHIAMLMGAGSVVLLGQLFNLYPLHQVIDAVWFEALALIFGMSMISATLLRSGLFHL
uniref:Uncharacterized protein n=1 Tax=Magnetococcus massalia (strain MO-1) TaxID=451514 RepID=A0A1S7LGE5_MAGMO|nr:membrane protein of unknown function [simiar to Magnetosome protein MamN N-terminal fragment] [Candidatus Magnetococcus massalia]